MAAARQLEGEVQQLRQATQEPLSDALAQFLVAQYMLAARNAARLAGGAPLDWNTLRALCADVIGLRRGDYAAARLRLDRDRFEEEAAKRKAAEEEARRKASRRGGISKETFELIERELNLL